MPELVSTDVGRAWCLHVCMGNSQRIIATVESVTVLVRKQTLVRCVFDCVAVFKVVYL